MNIKTIIGLLAIALAASAVPLQNHPVGDRCFSGGHMFKNLNQTEGISEICIKDDISMVKSVVVSHRSGGAVQNWIRFYRLFIVKSWQECNPVKDKHGNIMVIDIESGLVIKPVMYTCRADCEIHVNREEAEITLVSQKMNHYEVIGTTVSSGWFKQSISLSLEHTCEHVTINCGLKSTQLHACFRNHRRCVRYFHNTILPGYMAESICQNIELIILIAFSAMIFALLMMMSRTWLIYTLLPIFVPLAYLYGYIYDKSCKKCNSCGLAYHPFTKCGKYCCCGQRFTSSEEVKAHRINGFCEGYKSLRTARVLCKSKGSSLMISIFLAIGILSFITPVQSLTIKTDLDRTININDLPDDYVNLNNEVGEYRIVGLVTIMGAYLVLGLYLSLTVFGKKIFNYLFKKFYKNCNECSMIHERSGLTFNGDFTNKCGTCICGYEENIYYGAEDEYMSRITDMHKLKESCRYKPYTRYHRNFTIIVLALMIAYSMFVTVAYADELDDCLNYTRQLGLDDIENCTGLMLPISCENNDNDKNPNQIFASLKAKGVVDELDKPDFELARENYNTIMSAVELTTNIHRKILLEYIGYKSHCKLFSGIKKHAGSANVAWRAYIASHQLEACGAYPHKFICKCLIDTKGCHDTGFDGMSELSNFYTSNSNNYNLDLNVCLKTISVALRGLTTNVISMYFTTNKFENLTNYLNVIKSKLGDNVQLKGLIDYTTMLLSLSISKSPEKAWSFTTIGSNFADNVALGVTLYKPTAEGSLTTSCKNAQKLVCNNPRRADRIHTYLLCGERDRWHAYMWPTMHTVSRDESTLCLGDYHCNLKYVPVTGDTFAELVKMTCKYTEYSPNPGPMNISRKSCAMSKSGTCTTLENHPWSVVECIDELVYFTESIEHALDGNINSFCLSPKCKSGRYPIERSWLKDCVWKEIYKHNNKLKVIEHIDMASYRKSMESEIKTDLVLHEFAATKNLPKTVPQFKSLTLSGTVTSEGLQNTFIKGQIPAITGVSEGFHVYTPDGNILFDVVIYIKKAYYRASYEKIYSTGPTISINVKHNEQCTGSCPSTIPRAEGWLAFSKEHTSNWGCEEYGCFAIGSGCLFGSCQDVIRPELDIYRKVGTEQSIVEMCMTLPHDTYCTKLDVLEPIISDNVEIQFSTVDSVHMPNLIAIKKGKIYTGQVNDLGSNTRTCGSVQLVNNTVYGFGTPKFDYICHAFKRKDVVVRRCYDNFYEACDLLEKRNDLIINDQIKNMSISQLGLNLGVIDFRLSFGDIIYKQFAKEPDFDIKAECAGCINCNEEISCQFTVETTVEFNCKVATDCVAYTNYIMFSPAARKYSIKIACSDKRDTVKFKVCQKDVDAGLTLKAYSPNLDLGVVDESHYVKEQDLKCGTWLCKVQEEGLSIIFKPFLDKFGTYWARFLIGVIIVIFVLFLIYILIPVFKKIKDILQKNHEEYLLEMKNR
ncbi:glycoprotein precursor [Sedlec virus]|uniref:Envelopment polyprotein n=1 Tax=Sedlec virus TaxID=1383888 RepID=A0A346JEY4_9VIRU|nr:glycoprotein precursor [Sedlec virus]AXP32059.1 glycoprotein precursor [Sedlec virus]